MEARDWRDSAKRSTRNSYEWLPTRAGTGESDRPTSSLCLAYNPDLYRSA